MTPLLSTIDHLVYATPDVNATIEQVEQLFSVRAAIGGQHPGWAWIRRAEGNNRKPKRPNSIGIASNAFGSQASTDKRMDAPDIWQSNGFPSLVLAASKHRSWFYGF